MTGHGTDAAVRVGTRGSALARAQSQTVVDRLSNAGVPAELVVVSTRGDRDRTDLVELAQQTAGVGIFTSALRDALRSGRIDLAVHSYKDLPTGEADGLATLAVPEREAPGDVLVSASGGGVDDLPLGARVGTGSPRRAAQLRTQRPDLRVVPVRGNVDTRLALVGVEVDAVVLAAAGLRRLGRTEGTPIGFDRMLPAPGQGALAVEARADEPADWTSVVRSFDHRDSRLCVCAERAVLERLEAGCTAPVGALATIDPAGMRVKAVVLADNGSVLARGATSGPADAARALGEELARMLLADLPDQAPPQSDLLETGRQQHHNAVR